MRPTLTLVKRHVKKLTKSFPQWQRTYASKSETPTGKYDDEWDVVIVGGGPAGLAFASALGVLLFIPMRIPVTDKQRLVASPAVKTSRSNLVYRLSHCSASLNPTVTRSAFTRPNLRTTQPARICIRNLFF